MNRDRFTNLAIIIHTEKDNEIDLEKFNKFLSIEIIKK